MRIKAEYVRRMYLSSLFRRRLKRKGIKLNKKIYDAYLCIINEIIGLQIIDAFADFSERNRAVRIDFLIKGCNKVIIIRKYIYDDEPDYISYSIGTKDDLLVADAGNKLHNIKDIIKYYTTIIE